LEHSLCLIIFSKDRACQLDSLLRSVRDHFKYPLSCITVLHRSTSPEFAKGYEALANRNIIDKIAWRQENMFSDDVRHLLSGLRDDSLVMFLVDDTIVFRECVLDQAIDAFTGKHLFISLRASRTYSADTQPEFVTDDPFLEWKWNYSRRKWVTWNYPFSIDGNVFHACNVKKLVERISFEAPNSFEGRMHTYRHAWWIKRIARALALPEAVVFNSPLNRVQAEGETWHTNVTTEFLNGEYLSGMQIDNGALYRAVPDATHFAVPISFVKQ
jgi:hypothetical protein